MDYVTDTHSIVWYFTADARLSERALEAFEGTIEKVQSSFRPLFWLKSCLLPRRAELALRLLRRLRK